MLGGALALFLTHSQPHSSYALPHLKLVLQTVGALAGGLVALLAGVRFTTERRRFDLLLCLGFFVASVGTAAFSVAPAIAEQELTRAEAWAGVVSRLIAWVLIAAAPFATGASARRGGRSGTGSRSSSSRSILSGCADASRSRRRFPRSRRAPATTPPALLTFAYSLNAFLNLAAIVGFGLRFRERLDDLDRWLAFGASLMLFSSLHLVFTPLLGNVEVSPGDFLRVLGYGVFCVGVWRAIQVRRVRARRRRRARRGSRGRSTTGSRSTSSRSRRTRRCSSKAAPADELVPQIKHAATAAQQEARFAILALSSAAAARRSTRRCSATSSC